MFKVPDISGLEACIILYLRFFIIRPRRVSSRGSGFLLTKNRADQPPLSNVVQLRGVLPCVENGKNINPALEKNKAVSRH